MPHNFVIRFKAHLDQHCEVWHGHNFSPDFLPHIEALRVMETNNKRRMARKQVARKIQMIHDTVFQRKNTSTLLAPANKSAIVNARQDLPFSWPEPGSRNIGLTELS